MTSRILIKCIEEAKKSTYRFNIGCVIFKGTRIVSYGHNKIRYQSKISSKYRQWENSVHAEIDAIIRTKNWGGGRLNGCDAVIVKVSKTQHRLSNAKPCTYCLSALRFVGIKNIYYSNTRGEVVLLESE